MFNKLKRLWNPIPEDHSDNRQPDDEGPEETPAVASVGSSFELRKELLDKIVKNDFFRPFWNSGKISDSFVLWITPDKPAYQIEVGKKDFREALHKEFDNAELKAVGEASWLFEIKALPDNAMFTEIEDGVYLEIRNPDATPTFEQPKNIPTKAKISIVAGSGSLVQDEYLLDAGEQHVYQIGRGKNDKTGRINRIAIKDNTDDPLYKNNRYVSSAHAAIVFTENEGFCLKSLNANNRTIVYRGETKEADLKDLYSKSKPLQDGDRIELGKKVSLKFLIPNPMSFN